MNFQHQEELKERDAQRLLREDVKSAAGKVALAQYAILGVFVFLLAGFWELQVNRPEYYSEAAQKNRVKSMPVLAPRGKIMDRDGRVMVDNSSSFSVLLARETLKEEHLAPIAAGLNMTVEELNERLKRFGKRPKYEPVPIKEDLTEAEVAFVESHKDPETFPELELIQSHVRFYPRDGIASHVLGYVGQISDYELDMAEYLSHRPGDVVGKQGIEKQYDELLTGKDGQRRVLVDNRGRERMLLGMEPAEPGQNLQLTLDLDVQVAAEFALEGKRGAVVAIDPRNGEVLALASGPAFDPNKFAGRMSAAEWKQMLENPDKPMINRAIQAQMAPGSTFKPLVALAGLENGVIHPGFGVRCTGAVSYYGSTVHCHARRGHGGVGLFQSLAWSCDSYYYQVGDKLGIDRIAAYAEMAGFGRKTGIDLPHEVDGVLPSTKWKARVRRQKWYSGETIMVAIGQGYLTATPLQLAHGVGGMVVGGMWHKPHLIRDAARIEPARKGSLNLDNVAQVVNGMYGVVNGGTASRARIPWISMAGKTGTAQLVSNEYAKARGTLRKDLWDNAWFVGFAPKDNPEIVVAALYENGLHGDRAALIVRDVVQAYFVKKARKEQDRKVLAAQRILINPGLPEGAR
ncbi:MAG: penicillin-binding protein 2 [Bryobacteraceae bacterium]|nr:penicillin-binding protein 2 [Bryobacteraceae bacterium]